MKRKNFNSKAHSFEDLENLSIKYSSLLTPQQRLEIAQYLREQYYKIKGIKPQRLNKKIVKFGNNKKSETRKRF